MHTGVRNDVFEPFELADDQDSMSCLGSVMSHGVELALTPRTRIADIEVVAIFLWRKIGARLVLDEVPELALLSLE